VCVCVCVRACVRACVRVVHVVCGGVPLLLINNPLLSKVNYETIEITQEMILYGSSDLCTIRDGPHPLSNKENYILY